MTLELGGFDPQATYSAAAEDYERASQRFWQFLSTRTVERLALQPGQSVIDAACGTAPGTIAAARAVAPGGRVVGVDYADGMLAVAQRNVAESGVQGVELVQGDVLNMPYGAEFDAVMCVLGIFFIEDMAAAARSLWSHVRPGGTLAVTTFTHDVWTPMLDRFLDAAGGARPDIERVVPWRRTEDPDVLARALRDGGVSGVHIDQETVDIPFSPDQWPTIVMGPDSGGSRWIWASRPPPSWPATTIGRAPTGSPRCASGPITRAPERRERRSLLRARARRNSFSRGQ